jgi:hypothetical protein
MFPRGLYPTRSLPPEMDPEFSSNARPDGPRATFSDLCDGSAGLASSYLYRQIHSCSGGHQNEHFIPYKLEGPHSAIISM